MDLVADNTPAKTTMDMLQLVLSLSPASRLVAKGGGGGKQRRRLPDGEFQCRTCGRRFATFQALGGHRTSHKRPRVRAHGLDLLLGARPHRGAGAATHRCNTCGLFFPTGQALGGHMRRHRAPSPSFHLLRHVVAVQPPDQNIHASASAAAALSQHEEDDDDSVDDAHWPSTLIHFI